MDKIAKEANLEPKALNELLFADDQSLAHECEEHLQEHTSSLIKQYEDQCQQERDNEDQQDTRHPQHKDQWHKSQTSQKV